MKIFLLAILIIPFTLFAQSKRDGLNLNILTQGISEELKKNAHVVFRLDEGIVDVAAPGKYTYKVHQILTILNKDGAQHLDLAYRIDKYEKIEDIEIKVFNFLGSEVKKFKKKDFSVSALYDGISLVTDDKVMRLSVPAIELPVTLEIKYTREVTSHINLQSWSFQNYADAVELSRFIVKIPAEIGLRYKTENINVEPVITSEGQKKQYLWEAKNLPALIYQEGAGDYAKLPRLMIGANQFQFDGYPGTLSEWKGLGVWYSDLVKQTNQLSPKFKSEVQNLVSGISDDREKVRVLYANLQKNFRYVNIALGIGGFKPSPADFVHEKKYGDCKGLSNYMQACLNAVNIKSFSALINAGDDGAPVDANFPYNGFNHVILCVPLKNDTVWLECTSKDIDFGHLSNFTENRNALLVTETGGILVPTPKSRSNQNWFNVKTTVDISEDGSGKIDSRIIASGSYKYRQLGYSLEKDDVKKKYFVNELGFPNADQFNTTFDERTIQPLGTTIQFSMEKVHEFSAGTKMFLRPRFWKIWSSKLPTSEGRTEDFLFDCPFQKSDTTVLRLPTGYVSDALPGAKSLSCEFATYRTEYKYDQVQHAIYSITNLELRQHVIPAGKYAAVKYFFDEISKDDSQRIVIVKK